jgi:hypothetical protein
MLLRNKLLLVCRALFGAGASVPIGFLLYAIAYGSEATSFRYWLYHPISNPIEWAIYGAAMGSLWHLISELNKNSN